MCDEGILLITFLTNVDWASCSGGRIMDHCNLKLRFNARSELLNFVILFNMMNINP